MTQDTPSFFTLDRGTVSTSAALIGPVDGRYRLLAAGTAPAGVEPEAILEDLAWRVARTDARLTGSLDGWPRWSRLEVASWRPPRACLLAGSTQTGALLERAFVGAGWQVAARFFEFRPDLVALGEACLDPSLDAIIVGGRDAVDEAEREHMRMLWPLAGSLARWRDDVAVIACGPFSERPEGIPDHRLFSLPAPEPVAATAESLLRQAARQVGAHLRGVDPEAGDARAALRTTVASLASLFDNGVEAIEIGASAGSRTLARPGHELRHAVLASAAYLPAAMLDDEGAADPIIRWSTVKADPAAQVDRLRELALHPWSATDDDGARLRLAALHAALERVQQLWVDANDGRPDEDAPGVIVLSGGALAAVPSAAVALALVDTVRRPGAATILVDHARLLAPLGALPVEGDRRRLLADLVDDGLLPIGSALLTGHIAERATGGGSMDIDTALGADTLRLQPDQLRLVDLPPGIVARLEIDPEDGVILGVSGQRLTLEVSGGLGGLLVDTRRIPLELPSGDEQRRQLIERWEAPVWMADR